MIVVDASIVVELVTLGQLAEAIMYDLFTRGERLIVPHLVDIEVLSALRGLVAGRRLDPRRSVEFLQSMAAFPAERYSHLELLGRIWELRHNFTAYDAAYIALAEATDSTLYTMDAKLAKGHRARVALFGG